MFIITVLNYSWGKKEEFLKLQNTVRSTTPIHGLLFHFFCEICQTMKQGSTHSFKFCNFIAYHCNLYYNLYRKISIHCDFKIHCL